VTRKKNFLKDDEMKQFAWEVNHRRLIPGLFKPVLGKDLTAYGKKSKKRRYVISSEARQSHNFLNRQEIATARCVSQ
jgi:hypothetical protein